MELGEMVFYPIEYEENNDEVIIDLTTNPPTKIQTKRMVMIRTRIDGFEQTINVPLGGRK